MSRIPLESASRIIAGAMAKGRELGLKPLSIAVLDAGGHLISFARADGASNMRAQIAIGKAGGALALGVSSRVVGTMAAERPTFVASLASLAPQGIVPAAGGVIVVDETGHPIGAVGVTGDSSDNDEIAALAGIEAVGLSAQR